MRAHERLQRSIHVIAEELALAQELTPPSASSLLLLLRDIEEHARYLAGESERP